MNDKPENPPAFPIKGGIDEYQFEGMTKRDYFAGQALVALPMLFGDAGDVSKEEIAETAYWIADAMLAAGGEA